MNLNLTDKLLLIFSVAIGIISTLGLILGWD